MWVTLHIQRYKKSYWIYNTLSIWGDFSHFWCSCKEKAQKGPWQDLDAWGEERLSRPSPEWWFSAEDWWPSLWTWWFWWREWRWVLLHKKTRTWNTADSVLVVSVTGRWTIISHISKTTSGLFNGSLGYQIKKDLTSVDMMFSFCSVSKKMKKKDKQKHRKAYDSKLTSDGNVLKHFNSYNNIEISCIFCWSISLYFTTTEMMDSSTFKRFSASVESILENLEDADLAATGKYQVFPKLLTRSDQLKIGLKWNVNILSLQPHTDDDEIPEEVLLGKHQLRELGSDSAKIKTMGIFHKVRLVCLLTVSWFHQFALLWK